MAHGPEKKVKDRVKAVIAKFDTRVWYDMPVPGGYGKSTLDFIGCAGGVFFAVETKAYDHQVPTERQAACMRQIETAGGVAFSVCGLDDPDLDKFEQFLVSVCGEAR